LHGDFRESKTRQRKRRWCKDASSAWRFDQSTGALILPIIREYSRHPWRSRFAPPSAFAFAVLQTQSLSDIRPDAFAGRCAA
jgi:hypothetical protein